MTDIKGKFLGKWKLESVVIKQGENLIYPFGKKVVGLLFYDDEHMSVQIMMPVDSTAQNADPLKLKDLAWSLKNLGYMGYFGKYDIDEKKMQVIHHVEGAISQNIVGGDEVRNYRFEENRLILSTGPMELKWLKS